MTLPAAVLWDMDGTLVDSEPYWIQAEFALAERHGGTWSDEHALQLVGRDLLESGAYIRRHMGVDLTPEQVVDEMLADVVERVRVRVPWRPGARELLAGLRARRVPTALVTMSWRRFVEPVLAALPADSFSVVVTGDEVAHGKPHPEPYLAAARALGVDPAQCIALEDSVPGATSARRAGCRVLVAPLHGAVPAAPGLSFREDLAGVEPEHLAQLVGVPSATGRTAG